MFATTALATIDLHTGMSDLTSEAVITQMGLSVREETAAQTTMTYRYHHKILHAVSTTIGFLT